MGWMEERIIAYRGFVLGSLGKLEAGKASVRKEVRLSLSLSFLMLRERKE